jgi:hypothetical protein
MVKGDVHKKQSGYTVYNATGKKPVIKTCHQKTGYTGKFFEKTKGNYAKVTKSMICHRTKQAANETMKKLDSSKKKVVHKHWAVTKLVSGKWGVVSCFKSYEDKKLVRKYTSGKKVQKSVKCFKSKEDAFKRAKTANEKAKPKPKSYNVKGFKGMKRPKAKQVGRRRSGFGVRIGTKKGRYTKTPKGWRITKKKVPKKVHSGYAISKTKSNSLVLKKCYKIGTKRVFSNGKKIPSKITCYRLKSKATAALKKKRASLKKKKSKRKVTKKRRVVKRKTTKRTSVIKRRNTMFGSGTRRGIRLNYGFGI